MGSRAARGGAGRHLTRPAQLLSMWGSPRRFASERGADCDDIPRTAEDGAEGDSAMLQGLMMRSPLLISSLITHADRHHGDVEVVSRRVEGDIHRTTYRELHRRSRQLANALDGLGLRASDRVATLAWNGYRHLRAVFRGFRLGCGAAHDQPAPASGADRMDRQPCRRPRAVLRRHLPAADRGGRAALPGRAALGGDGRPRAHADEQQAREPAVLRGGARQSFGSLHLARVRRELRLVDVLHVRHHRPSEGRAVQPSLDGAAFARGRAARRAERLGA